jgi:hypothetical protein
MIPSIWKGNRNEEDLEVAQRMLVRENVWRVVVTM